MHIFVPPTSKPPRRLPSASTLLNCLAGLVVLGCLGTIGVLAVFSNGSCGGPAVTTWRRIPAVENALRQYSIDNGYPGQFEGLAVLIDPPGGEKPYLDSGLTDGWGRPLAYIAPETLEILTLGRSRNRFIVYSAGEDGIYGSDDDILRTKLRIPTRS